MNFKIKEECSLDSKIFEYLETVSSIKPIDLARKFNITPARAKKCIKDHTNYNEEGMFIKPVMGGPSKNPTNICYSPSNSLKKPYQIRKVVDGEKVYYGSYYSMNEAEKVVCGLEKVGWDKSQLNDIRKKLII